MHNLLQEYGSPLVLFPSRTHTGHLTTITAEGDSDRIIYPTLPRTPFTQSIHDTITTYSEIVDAVIFHRYPNEIEVILHHDNSDPVTFRVAPDATEADVITAIREHVASLR